MLGLGVWGGLEKERRVQVGGEGILAAAWQLDWKLVFSQGWKSGA